MQKTQKFISFLESLKVHNPALIEAIQAGFNIWLESDTDDDDDYTLFKKYNPKATLAEFQDMKKKCRVYILQL